MPKDKKPNKTTPGYTIVREYEPDPERMRAALTTVAEPKPVSSIT